jgi:ribonuclease D
MLDTPESLTMALPALLDAPSIALDVEFVRERTYTPLLSLIQIATPEAIWLLDPLMDGCPWPLIRQVMQKPRPVIMHAPWQDFEALALHDALPAGPLQDTQTATMMTAALLPDRPPPKGDTPGYDTLVLQELGHAVDKGEQRSPWARRPLTLSQITYAAQDVAFLHDLQIVLQERLAVQNRLAWFEEDMAFAVAHPLWSVQPKGAGLKPEWVADDPVLFTFYTLAQRLFDAREQRARKVNRPRTFLEDNEILLQVAAWACTAGNRSSPPGFLPARWQRRWPEWKALIRDIPALPDHPERNARQLAAIQPRDALVRALRTLASTQASLLKIPGALLATRDELKRFAYGEDDVRFLTGWRAPFMAEASLTLRAESCSRSRRAGGRRGGRSRYRRRRSAGQKPEDPVLSS